MGLATGPAEGGPAPPPRITGPEATKPRPRPAPRQGSAQALRPETAESAAMIASRARATAAGAPDM